MAVADCELVTDRLLAREWHRAADDLPGTIGLAEVVAELLTEPVTEHLLADWGGPYSAERADRWIEGRDLEGTTLLVADRVNRQPVGLVLLFEQSSTPGGLEVRLGYLLAEWAWGRGLATELVSAFVDWCRTHPEIHTIVAGVGRANVGSIRVLERCGFTLAPADAVTGGSASDQPDHAVGGDEATGAGDEVSELSYELQLLPSV